MSINWGFFSKLLRKDIQLLGEARRGKKQAIIELESLIKRSPTNKDAHTALGLCYYYGYTVEQNNQKAFVIFEEAAQLGCDLAMYYLGLMYQYGQAVVVNVQAAAYWYKKSAKNKSFKNISANQSIQQLKELVKTEPPHPAALTALGNCYMYGYGVIEDYKQGIDFYSKAVQCYDDLAMYYLGLSYHNGRGVPQHLSAAKYWYTKSIKHLTPKTNKTNQSQIKLIELSRSKPKYPLKNLSIYDAQVVIDFTNNGSTFSSDSLLLSQKWNHRNNKLCDLIPGENFLKESKQFEVIPDKKIRIYIVAHCNIASDFLFTNSSQKIHFNELANALAYYVGDQSAVINLVACCAGKGLKENGEDSFAAKLHLSLVDKLDRDICVVARTSIVQVYTDETNANIIKTTFDLDRLEKYKEQFNHFSFDIIPDAKLGLYYMRHQKKSKVIFMMKDHKQIQVDASTAMKTKMSSHKHEIELIDLGLFK